MPAGKLVSGRFAEGVTDRELVERARRGDRWAEEALYRRHVGPLLGLASRLLGSRAEAEDVVQETFVTAFDRLGQLREPEALAFWLQRIAVRRVSRRFRRRALARALGLDRGEEEAGLESVASAEAPPDVRADLALLDRALARLPARERLAWSLRHLEDRPVAEVAELSGCSLATAKRRIASASARLERQAKGGSHG